MRSGLKSSLENGEPISAKVTWLAKSDDDKDSAVDGVGDSRPPTRGGEDGGKTRFISCTPLLGGDDQVGVWIVVMVDNENSAGGIASRNQSAQRGRLENNNLPSTPDNFSNIGAQDQFSSSSNTKATTTDATSPPPSRNGTLHSKHQRMNDTSRRPSTAYSTPQQPPQHRRYQSMGGDSNQANQDSTRQATNQPNWSGMGKPWSLKEQERHRLMSKERGTLSRQDTEEIPRRSEEVGTI